MPTNNPRKKILVVDDERDLLDLVKIILLKEGYEVTTDLNGELVEVIKKDYPKDHPNLIILDISLAGKDGRQICQILKSQQETRYIPILFLSANNDLEKLAAQAGADDFLSKPFAAKELLHKLKTVLQAA